MRTRLQFLFSGVVLGVLAAVGVTSYAQPKRTAAPKLSTEDYVEIRELDPRYAHMVNGMNSDADAEAIATLWVEDGTWDSNPTRAPYRGRKEIGGTYLSVYKRRSEGLNSPRRLFASNNVSIEPSPEGAAVSANIVTVRAEVSGPAVVEYIGDYNDGLVKTRDGWRFKSRKVRIVPGVASVQSPQ